jgi:aryl-phospho-beta-D-glucosidase BglC (GH1 family)
MGIPFLQFGLFSSKGTRCRALRYFSSLLVALFCLLPAFGQMPDTSLAKSRAKHLQRGINLSEWFAQVYDPKGYTKEHFETWTTAQDIALIKAMGFDHVRLSVNPKPMWRGGAADQIPAEYLGYLDAAVKMILDQGLAVVLDIHPDGEFKEKLSGDGAVEEFADFWRALARHYSTYDPNKVFFETMNEPELHDHYRWNGIQAHLAAAIREGAPEHTIVVEGARWSDDDDLLFLEPLRDGNVIYNFHFYEPHLFTHQGASWGASWWHYLKGVPYPSTAENVEAAVGLVPDAVHQLAVRRYGAEQWNAKRIGAEFAQVAAWAKKWNVPLMCNEFGVYRKAANPEDRARWLSDVRTSLELNAIGWTMWDYSGGFGVLVKKEGIATVDEITVKALGLKVPGRQLE